MKVQEYMLKALKDAVQMEVEGRQFYLEAAKKVKSAGVREIMEYLAESEKYHIEKFNEIYRSLEKGPKLDRAHRGLQAAPARTVCLRHGHDQR